MPASSQHQASDLHQDALREAFLTLAGLVCTDHEADERGYLHFATEYEGVIRDRASVAYRLLNELGLERPASPYKPRENEGLFEHLTRENDRLAGEVERLRDALDEIVDDLSVPHSRAPWAEHALQAAQMALAPASDERRNDG